MKKEAEKQRAIFLRKEGKTYREILLEIPVAKSTLSEWFKSVQLAAPQKQRITQLRIDARKKGAESRRTKRITEINDLIVKGRSEVGKLTGRELWLIGIALYWAEGSKQNIRSKSTGIIFGNMDSKMILMFLKWLSLIHVPVSDINFELYVHRNRSSEAKGFVKWWINTLALPARTPFRLYFKKGNPVTKRSNVADLYHGLLRIRVKSSTSLNRQINGWIEGIATEI